MRVLGIILSVFAAGLASLGVYLLWAALTSATTTIAKQTQETTRFPDVLARVEHPLKKPFDLGPVSDSVEIQAKRPQGPPAPPPPPPAPVPTEAAKIAENAKILEQLPKGDLVLDGPNAMRVGETRTVHLNIGFKVPMDVLRKHIGPEDQKVEGQVAVSSWMTADLSGAGFKITRTTAEEQTVAEGYPSVWSWDVEAKDAGNQMLEATLYALISTGDLPSRRRITSFTHKITVGVRELTWAEWLKSLRDEADALKGLVVTLSGIVTGMVGWLAFYLDRRKRNGTAASPAPTQPA